MAGLADFLSMISNQNIGQRIGATQNMAQPMPQQGALAQYGQQPQMSGLSKFGSALTQFGDMVQQQNNPAWAKIAADKQIQARGLTPSDVQTALWYQNASPEERASFNATKRAQQFQDLGDRIVRVGPDGAIVNTMQKEVSPDQKPALKGEQAQASAIGAAKGDAQGTLETQAINAPNISELVKEAKDLLPQATNGGLQSGVKAGAQFLGISTDASKADKKLTVIGQKLTNYVPRFSGPQSDKDVESYRAAAGDVANTSLPTEDRLAGLSEIDRLNNKYLVKGAGAPVAPSITPDAAKAELARRAAAKGSVK